ncbi:histidine kinase/DNA gyrase B/HSP90-like ATPase [Chitinophaga polysaccharea]|uniref:histidine kinase n=1 Tax=Chitinophaga polysaccharea TaxID=1293035 RepID=A0A561P0Z0_9BACT|nr:HAMP domain-containing sensor histidine kinase [Chitinophaga polysaccharea]TWF31745.1 histidine kinase/DNA gyrase B/HSP90-like ATPase [Chitinophaga polysaccharea]
MTEKVRATDELLKDIFRGALHEFRAPINAITAAVRLLNDSPEGNQEFRKGLLQMISTSADNLGAIQERVDEVVQLEKIQKYQLCESHFDFRVWLHALIYSMYPIASEKDIKIIKQVSPDFPVEIEADKTYLTQILYNIIYNSIKYSDKSTIVTISCSVQEKICIEISDQGEGIPPAELPFIFNEYYQVDAGRKKKGVGLGLSIAKKLVEIMGGAITVKSVLSEGTAFSIQLPIR